MNYTSHRFAILFLFSSFILHPSSFLLAQVPALIHYQGRLVDGTNLYSGPARVSFSLFPVSSGGSAVMVSTSQVTVVDGLYATAIGQHVVFGNLNEALQQPEVWLQVTVNGTVLTPRERLLAVPYAAMTHGLTLGTNHSVVLNPVAGTNSIGAYGNFAVVGGGRENRMIANAEYAVIDGGRGNANYFSSYTAIGGGLGHVVTDTYYSVIGGGSSNLLESFSDYSVVAGGQRNVISSNAWGGAIGGGEQQRIGADADYAVIAGGASNTIDRASGHAFIGGGQRNVIHPFSAYAAIGGGRWNIIQTNTPYAYLGGG